MWGGLGGALWALQNAETEGAGAWAALSVGGSWVGSDADAASPAAPPAHGAGGHSVRVIYCRPSVLGPAAVVAVAMYCSFPPATVCWGM